MRALSRLVRGPGRCIRPFTAWIKNMSKGLASNLFPLIGFWFSWSDDHSPPSFPLGSCIPLCLYVPKTFLRKQEHHPGCSLEDLWLPQSRTSLLDEYRWDFWFYFLDVWRSFAILGINLNFVGFFDGKGSFALNLWFCWTIRHTCLGFN